MHTPMLTHKPSTLEGEEMLRAPAFQTQPQVMLNSILPRDSQGSGPCLWCLLTESALHHRVACGLRA